MLKKISTHQLVMDMYVHRLCGSWLDHPFWKKAFLLTATKQVDLIRCSGIAEVWIDTDKGLDLPTEETHFSALATLVLVPEPLPYVSDIGPCSLEDELARAGRLIAQGRGAVKLMFQDVRLGKAIDTEYCLPLVHDITQSVDRNPGAIVSLARLKTSDDYTYMHSVAVCALMIALARKLGLSDADTREAGVAGLVHDIGKAAIPSAILGKPGALTADEHVIMRRHPQAGHDMLLEARGVGEIPLDVCLHHHEKLNGRGYPYKLQGDAISTMARMGAVCDVYDAITSNRPYKVGWDPAMSIQRMAQWSREGHFDDAVLQAFIKSIGIYPIGSLVKLVSGRLAVVVGQSQESLLKPVVRTILDAATRQPCEPERIDLNAPGCRERIVSRETARAWGLLSIDDHWRFPSPA